MGAKTYAEQIKYNLNIGFSIDGVISESDLIGAIFGQTEGLLEDNLELKQLQNSGRIGRIVIKLQTAKGKTTGSISIPSSLDKVETAILAATIETVDRVGSCDANLKMQKIEDVRKDKRDVIAKRATEIIKQWDAAPELTDLADKILRDARQEKTTYFGPDKLTAGPDVHHKSEIILVEGRADVLNLMKHHITNAIEVKGTNVSSTIKNLCKHKTVTVFIDGDRGADFLLKELIATTSIDYIARAPLNKEVEDLSKEEILIALKNKVLLMDGKFLTEETTVLDYLEQLKQDSPGKHADKRSRYQQKPATTKSRYIDKIKSKLPKKKQKSAEKTTEKSKSRYSKKSSDDKRKSRSGKKSRFDKKSSRPNSSSRKRPQKRSRYKKSKYSKVFIPNGIKEKINPLKKTYNALLLDADHNEISSVPSSKVYETLVNNGDNISSIIIDGVITERLIKAAAAKQVKYIVGAVIGDIEATDEIRSTLTYTPYNRIK